MKLLSSSGQTREYLVSGAVFLCASFCIGCERGDWISRLRVLILGLVVAGPAEFHEFNFGHDVIRESEILLEKLGVS